VLAAYKKDRFTTPNQTWHGHSTRSTVKLSRLESVVVDLTATRMVDVTNVGESDVGKTDVGKTDVGKMDVPTLTTTPPTPLLSRRTNMNNLIPLEEDCFRFKKDGITIRTDGTNGNHKKTRNGRATYPTMKSSLSVLHRKPISVLIFA
jgi:hypothetical protein